MNASLNCLVMYKRKPARVTALGDKLTLDVSGGTIRVRCKDVTVLHPGPLGDPRSLQLLDGDPALVWEIVGGERLSVRDFAQLAFGAFTPEAALTIWAWQQDGTYFTGDANQVLPCGAQAVRARLRSAERRSERDEAWSRFIGGLRCGRVTDRRLLADVEALANAQVSSSKVLAALGRPQTPQAAHALLLELGVWTEIHNPHPARHGISMSAPQLSARPAARVERLDLTHLRAVAIDDAHTLYPDDAISLERRADGWRLWVHVADVAGLVTPESDLDVEARSRGVTAYLPERAAPMLPRDLSRAVALGLSDVSPALSVAVELDEQFTPLSSEVHLTRVRVARATYDEAQSRLEDGDRFLFALTRFTRARREQRAAAGAALIALPDVRVHVHEGQVTITRAQRLLTHDLVEEAMLLAGWGAARWAHARDLALPFAVQDAPRAEGHGSGLALQWTRRRGMRCATTSYEPAPHAGTGLEMYARVTSPLRRYADLLAHQQLRAELLGERPLSGREVQGRMLHAEAGAGAARAAQRDSVRHWTLVFLARHPGWRGEGEVVQRRGRWATVLVPELGYEFNVPLDAPVGTRVELRPHEVDLAALRVRFEFTTLGLPLPNAAD